MDRFEKLVDDIQERVQQFAQWREAETGKEIKNGLRLRL